MTLKDQLIKLKENWLLIVIVLVVIAFLNIGGSNFGNLSSTAMESLGGRTASQGVAYKNSYGAMSPIGIQQQDFAPEVADRKITKSSSLATDVETGAFKDAESKLKSIIKISGSYLLNENVQKYDSGRKEYYVGSYQIKVDSKKYDDLSSQLKAIGEVKSFNENSQDITASYKNLEIELNVEKERLDRYNKMYSETTLTADKIQLSDRIFDEERTIKYLEDSMKNVNQQVDYSTIYVTLNEKQPKYANIVFVKFSELVKSLVASVNSLLKLIFVVAPYAVAGLIVWFIVRMFRKRE